MGFLRTLFWIAITVVVVVFSFHNWTSVTLDLFGGLQADAKLPVLLFIAFLLGFLPLYIWHRVQRWGYQRRMIEQARLAAIAPAPLTTDVVTTSVEPL
jgi:putative membrane protein